MSKILNSRLKVTFAYRSPVVSNRQTPDSTTGRHGFARFLCHPFLASWSGAREVGQDHGGTWGWEIFRRIFRRIWEVIFGGYSMKNGDWMYFNMVRWDWMGVWWDSFHKPWYSGCLVYNVWQWGTMSAIPSPWKKTSWINQQCHRQKLLQVPSDLCELLTLGSMNPMRCLQEHLAATQSAEKKLVEKDNPTAIDINLLEFCLRILILELRTA